MIECLGYYKRKCFANSCHDFECYDDDVYIVWVIGVRPYRYGPLAQEKQPREAAERNINKSKSDIVTDGNTGNF